MKYIGIIGENSIELINKILDLWNKGFCVVLFDYKTPIKSLIEMLVISKCTFCYLDESIYEINNFKDSILFKNSKNLFVIYKNNFIGWNYLPLELYKKYKVNFSEEEALIIFSSGTTFKEKGIVLSHKAITQNAIDIIKAMGICQKDTLLIIKKISHSSTFIGEIMVSLINKNKIIIGPCIITPQILLNKLIEFRVTICCMNPTIIRLFSKVLLKKKYKIDKLKYIFVSGDIFYEKDICNIRTLLPNVKVRNMYGLTEAGPRVTMQNDIYCTTNSVGVPIGNTKIKIINFLGMECCANEIGKVFVNSTSRFTRYINSNISFNIDKDNWLDTNDLGYYSNNGELYIIGRSDSLILYDSHVINPQSIENSILECSLIEECSIQNIIINSRNFLCCLYTCYENINVFDIRKELMKKHISYEIPKYFFKIEEFKKNKNGKRDNVYLKKIAFDLLNSKGVNNEY